MVILFITCIALAKAGLVVGPLRPSICLFVCLFIHLSVLLSATLLGCLVSFIFKLCLMIVHTLKMCTSYFVHNLKIFLFLRVLNLDIFPSVMRSGCQVCVICNSNSFYTFIFKPCIMTVHTLKMCTYYFVHIL